MRHHLFLLKELVKRDFQGRYAGSVLGVAFSPDGKMLAYTSGAENQPRQIYVRSIAGGDAIRITKDRYDDVSPSWSAQRNVVESEQYDRLLKTNPAFRQARMRKECGPITDPQLHHQCLESFARY